MGVGLQQGFGRKGHEHARWAGWAHNSLAGEQTLAARLGPREEEEGKAKWPVGRRWPGARGLMTSWSVSLGAGPDGRWPCGAWQT